MIEHLYLLLLDFALLYIAGLMYKPKMFLIPPLVIAAAVVLTIAGAIYLVHIPIIILSKIPILGVPFRKFLDIEMALVVALIVVSIGVPILNDMKKEVEN